VLKLDRDTTFNRLFSSINFCCHFMYTLHNILYRQTKNRNMQADCETMISKQFAALFVVNFREAGLYVVFE